MRCPSCHLIINPTTAWKNSTDLSALRCTPMKVIVGGRDLLSAAERVIGIASSSLCCDHCRRKLRLGVHRYWRMRFCCAVCMNAYQERLSPNTQRKIYEIDSHGPSWKAAS